MVALYPSKAKTFLLAAGSLLFVLTGLFLLRDDDPHWFLPSWFVNAIFLFGICFASFCFVVAARRLLFPKPLVIISEEGISDGGSVFGVGLIKWGEIKEVVPCEDYNGFTTNLGIIPIDKQPIIARQPRIRRLVYKGSGEVPFQISTLPLTVSLKELLRIVEERRPQ